MDAVDLHILGDHRSVARERERERVEGLRHQGRPTHEKESSLGVDNNAIYIGCNMFTASFQGTSGWVIRKTSVLSGGNEVWIPSATAW